MCNPLRRKARSHQCANVGQMDVDAVGRLSSRVNLTCVEGVSVTEGLKFDHLGFLSEVSEARRKVTTQGDIAFSNDRIQANVRFTINSPSTRFSRQSRRRMVLVQILNRQPLREPNHRDSIEIVRARRL